MTGSRSAPNATTRSLGRSAAPGSRSRGSPPRSPPKPDRHRDTSRSSRPAGPGPAGSSWNGIADALDVSARDRAELLRAAGLAASVSEHLLTDAEVDAHRNAIERLLSTHEPFPACAMDTYGRVLALNRPCALINPGIDALSPEELVDAAVGPGPARTAIVNFAEVAHGYVERLERRARASADPRLRALADRAHRHVADIPRPRNDASGPTLTIQLHIGDGATLSMLAAIVRFEHASDITLAELRIELLFPADESTRRWFEGLAAH